MGQDGIPIIGGQSSQEDKNSIARKQALDNLFNKAMEAGHVIGCSPEDFIAVMASQTVRFVAQAPEDIKKSVGRQVLESIAWGLQLVGAAEDKDVIEINLTNIRAIEKKS
jgi:hypothetical protein